LFLSFRNWNLGFVSDFEFRISDLLRSHQRDLGVLHKQRDYMRAVSEP
jgi:hypothetical protein